MTRLSRQQLILLVLLTLVWGFNWPIMKFGVTGFPPLTFRTICMWLGLPVLAGFLLWRREPFAIARTHWRELAVLTVFNMFFCTRWRFWQSSRCPAGAPPSWATPCRCSRP